MIEKERLLTLERPRPHCTECNGVLEDLDSHPTRLMVDEKELQRTDYCPDCWEFVKEETYDSFWVTRRIKKEKRVPKLSRREKAVAVRALFESLWEKRDREDVEVHLYFLAHLLLRWRGLRWKRNEVDAEGRELIVFEHPATGDLIEILSVDTTNESIAAIKEEIENFLRDYAPEQEALVE